MISHNISVNHAITIRDECYCPSKWFLEDHCASACSSRRVATYQTNRASIFPVSRAAPSEVLAIRQENTSQNSVTLMWHQPRQPNGVILEYDVKYYEKVQSKPPRQCLRSWKRKNMRHLRTRAKGDTVLTLPGEQKLIVFKGLHLSWARMVWKQRSGSRMT